MRAIFVTIVNNLTSAPDKCNVGREYFSVFGLGKMIVSGNDKGGEVRLVRSHIDEGWVKKWGNHDKPINHFACGYIAAMFGAAFDKPLNTYAVKEAASIAVGDPENKFIVKIA
jgi:predicted hydrocarbon binding protein